MFLEWNKADSNLERASRSHRREKVALIRKRSKALWILQEGLHRDNPSRDHQLIQVKSQDRPLIRVRGKVQVMSRQWLKMCLLQSRKIRSKTRSQLLVSLKTHLKSAQLLRWLGQVSPSKMTMMKMSLWMPVSWRKKYTLKHSRCQKDHSLQREVSDCAGTRRLRMKLRRLRLSNRSSKWRRRRVRLGRRPLESLMDGSLCLWLRKMRRGIRKWAVTHL